MTGWAFALSKRWAGYLALAVVFAIVCSALGLWQFARRAEAQAEIARIEANYDADPVPVADALPSPESFETSQRWLSVLLEGRYLEGEELLVRGRPLGGQPGFEVLAPLLLDDGSVFIVDRGWLPTGEDQDDPDAVPPAPDGQVTVTARLKAGEPTIAGRESVPGSGQVATIHLPEVARILADAGYDDTYTGAYGLVASEDPEPAVAPTPAFRPIRDEGPHLSYALQWFVFAILGFIALGWALRQEYRAVNSDDPDEQQRAAERERRRAAKAPSDSETEDAILDNAR
ncbi:MAG: hypothetical protein RI885_799 [Actinomycetota bacterium]